MLPADGAQREDTDSLTVTLQESVTAGVAGLSRGSVAWPRHQRNAPARLLSARRSPCAERGDVFTRWRSRRTCPAARARVVSEARHGQGSQATVGRGALYGRPSPAPTAACAAGSCARLRCGALCFKRRSSSPGSTWGVEPRRSCCSSVRPGAAPLAPGARRVSAQPRVVSALARALVAGK